MNYQYLSKTELCVFFCAQLEQILIDGRTRYIRAKKLIFAIDFGLEIHISITNNFFLNRDFSYI